MKIHMTNKEMTIILIRYRIRMMAIKVSLWLRWNLQKVYIVVLSSYFWKKLVGMLPGGKVIDNFRVVSIYSYYWKTVDFFQAFC